LKVARGFATPSKNSATEAYQSADKMFEDALALERAGADMLLLECVPEALATRISKACDQ